MCCVEVSGEGDVAAALRDSSSEQETHHPQDRSLVASLAVKVSEPGQHRAIRAVYGMRPNERRPLLEADLPYQAACNA